MIELLKRPSRLSMRRASAVAAILSALTLNAFSPPRAAAQEAQASSADELAPDGSGAPESDLLRPKNLFELAPQYKLSNGSPSDSTTYELDFRSDRKIPINEQWTIGFRFDAPYDSKNAISSFNPNGEFISGLGDIDVQTALVRKFNDRWAAGGGVRLYAPTGGNYLGSGKWEIMPGAAFRYALPEISGASYFEPELRYDASFAGNPAKKSVSELQFGPSLNFGLPNRWYFQLYPSDDIRWNFGDPVKGQTGRLFLPFDAKIGRQFSDKFNVSLEASVPIVQDYPVYKLKTVLYIDIRY